MRQTTARREKHYKWKGGRRIVGGYVMVYIGNERYVPEHRLVVEETLGRPLSKEEIVHHRDENRLNNRPENLEVMTRSEHISVHRISTLPRLNGRWSFNHSSCIVCGTTTIVHQGKGRCHNCYNRECRK